MPREGAASALVALIEFSNPENQSALVTMSGTGHREYRFQREYDCLWKIEREHQRYFR
jgi:hypothetical protein